MVLFTDALLFIKNLFTIIKGWVTETRLDHKFTNVLMPIIAVVVILFSFLGFIFQGYAWRTIALWVLIFWCGQQTQGLISVFKRLKKEL